jgi:hypothetical protein
MTYYDFEAFGFSEVELRVLWRQRSLTGSIAAQADKTTLLFVAYKLKKQEAMRLGKRALMFMLSDTTKKHHAFVTEEEGGYLVSILKQPDKNKESYVEILVQEGHYFYDRIRDAVSVLHVADTGTEVEGVGEAFATGVYHIVIDTDEHNKLKEGK